MTHAAPRHPRLPEQASLLLWAFGPFGRMAVPELYTLLAANAFTARGLYLNLGYWDGAQNIDAASEALVRRVGTAAGLGPADEMVDVGFGFADQDILWAREFGPRRITGLNVTPLHVKIGRERVRRLGLGERIDLRLGSATAMDLPDGCCDVVTALECAFHFDTRERFFAEAFRVLRPGGRLVTADIIRAVPDADRWRQRVQDVTWALFARRFTVPDANAVGRPAYQAQLTAAGFEATAVESIRDKVFPGWHRALREDRALRRRLPLAAQVLVRALAGVPEETLYGALDYVLGTARKPERR